MSDQWSFHNSVIAAINNSFKSADVDGTWHGDCGYACGGIIVEDCHVVDAAPVFTWTIGKKFSEVKAWRRWKSLTKCPQ